ncbi:MAG: hypothetical protein EAZ60_03970 [Oscillatoriales cyanobacterium]|nr:MAG: hypothetical protein EAZ60_03970 [Oscillatoriales cyanobacterium]
MSLVAYHCAIVLFDRKFGDRPAAAIDAGLRNRVLGDNSSSQSADSQKNPVSLGLMGKFHTIYHCEALSVIARNEAISASVFSALLFSGLN